MTADTLIRLPHSGLLVPNADWKVTSYKSLNTADGVAFNATLRWKNRIVGSAENQGYGGGTWARMHDNTANVALDEFVQAARYDDGTNAGEEQIMDDLVTEYEWTKRVRQSDKKNGTALRLMVAEKQFEGMQPYADEFAIWSAPITDANRDSMITQLGKHTHSDSWWQVWNGQAWDDLTARPLAEVSLVDPDSPDPEDTLGQALKAAREQS